MMKLQLKKQKKSLTKSMIRLDSKHFEKSPFTKRIMEIERRTRTILSKRVQQMKKGQKSCFRSKKLEQQKRFKR